MVYIVILVAAFAVVAALNWKYGNRRGCRWRADTGRDRGALRFYQCAACGAEAYTAQSGPPKDCKQGLGKGAL